MDIASKYIIAGSFNEYRLYIRDKQLDGIQYKWVSNVDSIRGLNDISGVFIGTWADRDDIVKIIQQIHIIKTRYSFWLIPEEIAKVYSEKFIGVNTTINPQPANHITVKTTSLPWP